MYNSIGLFRIIYLIINNNIFETFKSKRTIFTRNIRQIFKMLLTFYVAALAREHDILTIIKYFNTSLS